MPSDEHSDDNVLPIRLKWSKQVFDMMLRTNDPPLAFKQQVQTLTGVPIERQKLLSKGAWKGSLSDAFDLATIRSQTNLVVSLIGSAETLTEPPITKPTFLEDLTTEQLEQKERETQQAAMAEAEGMIPAIQLEPHKRHTAKGTTDDVVQYNRLVSGVSQAKIESLLLQQRDHNSPLLGKVVMTMGMELRRAYVNDMAVLDDDGTIVSALDDGHIQLWKHGALVRDLVHDGGWGGNVEGGVDSVMAFAHTPDTRRSRGLSFASAGRSCIRVWSTDYSEVCRLPAPQYGTSPTSLVEVPLGDQWRGLAVRFRITRPPNPGQFRLQPQNDTERQRRRQAEAQEEATQATLSRISNSIQIWYSDGNRTTGAAGSPGGVVFQSVLLQPRSTAASSITDLTILRSSRIEADPAKVESEGVSTLVAGDVAGYLCFWTISCSAGSGVHFEEAEFLRISTAAGPQKCSIVALQSLSSGRLAVSTSGWRQTVPSHASTSSNDIPQCKVPVLQAVHIFQYNTSNGLTLTTTLDGHKDVVSCVCELPDATTLLTTGGKHDATIQVWTSPSSVDHSGSGHAPPIQHQSTRTLEEIGYVFSLVALKDQKHGSKHVAVAAARYNAVKIVI